MTPNNDKGTGLSTVCTFYYLVIILPLLPWEARAMKGSESAIPVVINCCVRVFIHILYTCPGVLFLPSDY